MYSLSTILDSWHPVIKYIFLRRNLKERQCNLSGIFLGKLAELKRVFTCDQKAATITGIFYNRSLDLQCFIFHQEWNYSCYVVIMAWCLKKKKPECHIFSQWNVSFYNFVSFVVLYLISKYPVCYTFTHLRCRQKFEYWKMIPFVHQSHDG